MKNRNFHKCGLSEDGKPRGWETNVRCAEESHPSNKQEGQAEQQAENVRHQYLVNTAPRGSMRPLLERSVETYNPGPEGVCEKLWKSDKMVCDFGGRGQTLEGEPHVGVKRGHSTDTVVQ